MQVANSLRTSTQKNVMLKVKNNDVKLTFWGYSLIPMPCKEEEESPL